MHSGRQLGCVGNVNECLRSHHTAESIAAFGMDRVCAVDVRGEGGWRILHRGDAEGIAVASCRVANSASHMRTAFSSIVSNTGSSSTGEPADDLEHVGGRGLLLAASSSRMLVEQARVLDRDDRLGGEVLDQLDLLVGEWPHLLAIDAR